MANYRIDLLKNIYNKLISNTGLVSELSDRLVHNGNGYFVFNNASTFPSLSSTVLANMTNDPYAKRGLLSDTELENVYNTIDNPSEKTVSDLMLMLYPTKENPSGPNYVSKDIGDALQLELEYNKAHWNDPNSKIYKQRQRNAEIMYDIADMLDNNPNKNNGGFDA